MIISYELSMPGVASWDGKWSGGDNKYYIIKSDGRRKPTEAMQKILDKGYFLYRWKDGWSASVTVEHIDAAEARKRRKISQGFCSYDWMVDSIIEYGEIKT